MTPRPSVWFVDDLQSNLDAFKKNHAAVFDVHTFSDPNEVLRRLGRERPDALLCDIFFYESQEKAKDIEEKVAKAAQGLRTMARSIGADSDRYLAGIVLMEGVAAKYGGAPPFPLYAYTSKGPYLLEQPAWDRIARCGARTLLKNRFGPQVEQLLIQRDIETERERNSWRAWIARYLYAVFITGGIFSAIVGWVLCRFFSG